MVSYGHAWRLRYIAQKIFGYNVYRAVLQSFMLCNCLLPRGYLTIRLHRVVLLYLLFYSIDWTRINDNMNTRNIHITITNPGTIEDKDDAMLVRHDKASAGSRLSVTVGKSH